MEEVRRVSTTKEKKKSTILLIVLAVLLGIALIGTAVYFYTLEETPTDVETITETTCACYYIDPAIISECGDPRRGFLFELTTVTTDRTCSAPCSTENLSPSLLNSDTDRDLYQICRIPVVQDARCNEMTIKDGAGRIVTGKVSDDDEITIEATFDDQYSDHKFVINNQEIEPDALSNDQLTIRKTYSDLSAPTLNIFATATDSAGNQINSPVCRRLIETDLEAISDVSEIQVQTRRDGDVYKVSRIRIGAGNLSEDEELRIRFSFNKELSDILMNEGFTIDSAKGEITIIEQDLYDPENFGTDLTFAQLDGQEGEIEITAEIRTDTELIGSVEGTFDIPAIEQEPEEEIEEPTEEEPEESRFSVTKESNVTCVERVGPDNIAQFTLSATNQGNTNQKISSVKDKLPLGFTYVGNSTRINNVSVTDSEYVTITDVGDTQEVVWEKTDGWSVDSGQSLTIVFQAQADNNALTGSNQNEVIVTPEEVPEDPGTLRAEVVIEVAQSCKEPEETDPVDETEDTEEEDIDETIPEDEDATTPDTGIFDSTIGRIIIGLLVIVTGWYIYSKPMGQAIVQKLIESGLYKETELFSWKIFQPKKYFETKIVRKLDKKDKKKK